MPHRVLLALALLLAGACRSEISLGIPDASVTPADGGQTVPPRCPGTPSRSVVTVAGESWGELRAIAAGAGQLHALFMSPTTNEGVLARVSTSGGELTEIARVGLDPSSLALSADGAFAFVAARGSAQVFRVDGAGRVVVANAGGAPASVVADDQGGAYWALPLNDGVVRWSFATGAPLTVATSARATSLRRAGGLLYIVGNRTVSAFDPRVDAAPRKLAEHCDDGTPAVDGQVLYCAESDAISAVDLTRGIATVVAPAQPGAANVVVAAGRILWRAAPSSVRSLVMALPLDGIGGITVFESSGPGALAMAVDGCDLYFSAGRSLVRRGL